MVTVRIVNVSRQKNERCKVLIANELFLKMELVIQNSLEKLGFTLYDLEECHLLLANLSDFNAEGLVDELVSVSPIKGLKIANMEVFKGVVISQIVSTINKHFNIEDLLLLSKFKSTDAWGNIAFEK